MTRGVGEALGSFEEEMAWDNRKQVTRERILESALDAFARRGFNGATVEAIAKGADRSKASAYDHFASKENLFVAAGELAGERFLDSMRAYSSTASLQSLAAYWVRELSDDGNTSWLLRSLGGDRRKPAVVGVAQSVQDGFVEFWCEWLRRRESDCSARPAEERATLARFIVASLAGIALMTFDPGDEVSGAMLGRLASLVETAEVNWVDGGQV